MSLYDIELLQHIFYRSEYILKYLERHKYNMSLLDIEAISNTILNELVINNIIDPNKQSLDLDNMRVVNNLDHICYQDNPFVIGIPSTIKEQARNKIITITGGYPISVHMARPSGRTTYCIYDANTALSTLFDKFEFVDVTYDSPTRIGTRTNTRPFIVIEYNNYKYYVDLLTKRMFRRDLFDYIYNTEIIYSIKNKDFNNKQKELYFDQIRESDTSTYASLIIMINGLMTSINKDFPKMEEYNYEFELSKERFPEAFEESRIIEEDIKRLQLK